MPLWPWNRRNKNRRSTGAADASAINHPTTTAIFLPSSTVDSDTRYAEDAHRRWNDPPHDPSFIDYERSEHPSPAPTHYESPSSGGSGGWDGGSPDTGGGSSSSDGGGGGGSSD